LFKSKLNLFVPAIRSVLYDVFIFIIFSFFTVSLSPPVLQDIRNRQIKTKNQTRIFSLVGSVSPVIRTILSHSGIMLPFIPYRDGVPVGFPLA
jgi:membrane protein implicated in regulation of membrane protease activity